ncbi:MAG: hypothetical protein C5B54_00765 [Acidobacteria bacterium]|nr:MAG: hypothetical protein C5B54_00765 [Acidobacteriota bacterium]
MLQKVVSVGGWPQAIAFPSVQRSDLLINYDSVIISDIHLGSPMCQARELDEFLSRIRVQHLILAGDIFEDLKFNRLQHWHWQVLSRLRKISDHCNVVWIRGNHDMVSAPTMSHLLGVNVRNNFAWDSQGMRFFTIHGDRWDTFIYKHQRTTSLVTWLYNSGQRMNSGLTRSICRYLKKKVKVLTRNSEAVQFGALKFAERKGYDAIFCGHTHMAMLTRVGNIVYGNDGTWQSDDPHFIGILGREVHLCKYLNGQVILISRESL